MEDIWKNYLDNHFPVRSIDEMIVYTDNNRYWLTEGILDAGEMYDWDISVTFLDQVDDEQIFELRQSFGIFNQDTLLVVFFSKSNPNLDMINTLFSPFESPHGFQGYSLLGQYTFPNQFFRHFAADSIHTQLDNLEEFSSLAFDNLEIKSEEGTYLNIKTRDSAVYPFHTMKGKHILFPATEIVFDIEYVDGTALFDQSISAIYHLEELVDPMGRIENPISMLIQDNKIVEVRGENSMIDTIDEYIIDRSITSIGFGLASRIPATGFVSVDRLFYQNMTLCIEDEVNMVLNFDTISHS